METLHRALSELHRRHVRRDLAAWCRAALEPLGQAPAAHHRLLIRELQAVADGKTDRLMVMMPPGSAKSTYASVLFPAWFLASAPRREVIGASYNADLAQDFSSRVLQLVREHSGLLGYAPTSESRALWRTTNDGVYRAVGVGGGITGRRADLFVIDDPIRGRQDADSAAVRDGVWNWYRAEVITRLRPRASVVLIQTRWHEDDLAGRLLAEDSRWRVLSLPALATENDPLGRAEGDPLWPEWEDAAALARKRAEVGEREWASLFQQTPRPMDGGLFRVGSIAVLEAEPVVPGAVVTRAWDLAATDQVGTRDPDWTVGVKMARYPDGRFAVLNVARLRGGPDAVLTLIRNTAALDGPSVAIRLPQDPGQAGVAQASFMTRALAGYRVTAVRETGDKATRAAPFASQVNVGNVSMVRAPWNRAYLDELDGFPGLRHDDQVDASSAAFAALAQSVPARLQPLVV